MTDDHGLKNYGIPDSDFDKIVAPLYTKVFSGQSTAQEGLLVFMDLLNFSEALQDVPETNATVYKHLGKRSVGLRIMKLAEFTEGNGRMGFAGISKIHKAVESAEKLLADLKGKYDKIKAQENLT